MDDAAFSAEFLGEQHAAIARSVLYRIERVAAGDAAAPRVMLLTGEQGLGKSRIVREVYGALQRRQGAPAYWPALPAEPGADPASEGGRDPLAQRKRLGPEGREFHREGRSLPSFTWWSFNCDRLSDDGLSDVVSQARPHLALHFPFASHAASQRRGVLANLSRSQAKALEHAREVGTEAFLEAMGKVLEKTGGEVPGLGLALEWVGGGVRAAQRHAETRRLIEEDASFGGRATASRRAEGRLFAECLRSMSAPGMPAVAVVEDAHLMDEGLAEFLDRFAQREQCCPTVVVATAWPQAATDRSPCARWIQACDTTGNLHRVTVPSLPQRDLQTMVLTAAPDADPADTVAITERFTTPLSLQLFLGLAETRRVVEGTRGRLPVEELDLDHIPFDIRSLYDRRLAEWSPDMRVALQCAAASLPDGWRVGPFVDDVVAAAADRAGVAEAPDVAGGLRRARDVGLLVQADEGRSVAFRESLVTDLLREGLSSVARGRLRDATVDQLRTAVYEDVRAQHEAVRAQGIISDKAAVAPEIPWLVGLVQHPTDALDAYAQLTWARQLADQYHFHAAISLAREGLPLLPADDSVTVRIKCHEADWYGELGQVDRSVHLLQDLLGQVDDLSGADGGELRFMVAVNLARWLQRGGRFEQALAVYETLGDDVDSHVVNNRALALADQGNLELALAELQQLLEHQIDLDRATDSEVRNHFAFRGNVASLLSDLGRTATARVSLAQLLAEAEECLGPDDPETLVIRSNWAAVLSKSGDDDEALFVYRQLVRDRTRILGRNHPATLIVRNQVAMTLANLGRHQEALGLLRELLPDQVRELGADHVEAMVTRNNIASCVGRLGDPAEAVRLYRALLADRQRVLDEHHEHILTTRANIAHWLEQDSRSEEAFEVLRELLRDEIRHLGPQNPMTQRTKASFIRLAEVRRH